MTTAIPREQFLQALRDHPDWREEIRVQILGEELMRLPVAFQAFVVSQEKLNDEMREFRDNQLQFNQEALRRFDNIDRRLDRMESDSSWMKNFSTEYRAGRGAFAICPAAGCDLRQVLSTAEVNDIATRLASADITRGDRISFFRADLIVEADQSGETVYLAVEISYTAAERDLRRAQRNAQYLAQDTGCRAVPVVTGVRYDDELQTAIDRGEIIWVELEEP